MAIKMIHHVNVQINDRERTRAWYEKVLGAEFLDRGPALNRRQLQLRLGSGEIHFTVTPRPTIVSSSHFAIEVDDWDGFLKHLTDIGVRYTKPVERPQNNSKFCYINDPDGTMIELVYHGKLHVETAVAMN